jgi:hypothetical protein
LYQTGGKPSTGQGWQEHKRADDKVVHLRPIGDHDHMLALSTGVAQFPDRRGGVGQQALLVSGIDPGSCDHSRAIARTDLVLVGIDQCIKSVRSACWPTVSPAGKATVRNSSAIAVNV